MVNRYRPRRRARSVGDGRQSTRRGAMHRRVRRRGRGAIFAAAIGVTAIAAATDLGLFPSLQAADPAAATVPSTSFASARLAVVSPVVEPKKASGGTAVPTDSGSGRRVVFSQSAQRVWLVRSGGQIADTYLVSGSTHDNLRPGKYAVFTRARQATAYDYESQLAYFVGFFQGKNATIGFHDIPVGNDGKVLQTTAELGTPLSSGCIRQDRRDAIALWNFAPVGTPVVVVA